MMINLLLLTCIVVFIIDLSGVIDSIKKALWKKYVKVGDYHNLSLKPISCSLCMTFWIGLIYLICSGAFTLPYIALVCLYALLTPQIGDLLILFKELLTYLINLPLKNL